MKEIGKIKELERLVKKKFSRATIPSGFEVCEKQLYSLVKRVHDVEVNENGIEKYMPAIYDELKDLSKEEIIKRFVSTEFNRFLEYYKNAPDLNANAQRDHSGNERGFERKGVVKLFVSLGAMDSLDKDSLKDYISATAGIDRSMITWADVRNSFSFIEVKMEVLTEILNAFSEQRYRGRKVRIESRGNKEEGIPRQRFRKNRSDRNDFSFGKKRKQGKRKYSEGRW
jgi:ATP-dependent RNA helicase DeaD